MVGVKIKPLPKKLEPTSEDVSAMIARVQEAVAMTLNLKQSSISFAEVYALIAKLADGKNAALLYDSLQQIKPTIAGELQAIFVLSDCEFPQALETKFTNHTLARKNLQTFFTPLDGFINSKRLVNINELVLVGYREFLELAENRRRIQVFLLSMIRRERTGEWVDRDVIAHLCRMLVAIGINSKEHYQNVFEKEFIAETRVFYVLEAREVVTASTWPEFVDHARKRFSEETLRVTNCMDSSTLGPLTQTLLDCFVRSYYQPLTESPTGMFRMMEELNVSDVKKTYALLKDDDEALAALRQCVYNHVASTGEAILKDAQTDVSTKMHKLLSLQTHMRTFLISSFSSSRKLEDSIRSALERVCNISAALSQLLALYVDTIMVKEIRQMADSDVEILLDNVITIFRYLTSKDIFEVINKTLFAKRLLYKTSISNDAEKAFIRKMKLECGATYTRKVEGMIADIEAAQQQGFEETQGDASISLTVLKDVNWPSDSLQMAPLPTELEPLRSALNTKYTAKFPRRLLNWKTNYGTAEVTARLGTTGATYDLVVSTYQMIILMKFNDIQKLVYADLMESLGVRFDKEFPKHVFGLIAGKVIVKNTPTKVLEPECELQVAPHFESKLRRIRITITAPRSKAKLVIAESPPNEVLEARKHLTEACIVRVMKARRQLDHPLLVAEVIKQLSHKFPPDPKDIKLRIESLIAREYLARGEGNSYTYVA